MTPAIEEILQKLGNEALAVCGCEPIAMALYAEAESGAVSASIFFTRQGSDMAHFKFGGRAVSALVHDLWNKWQEESKEPAWCALTYTVRNGKFSADFTYPEKFTENLGEGKRRLAAAASVIEGRKIDYANP